MTLKKERDARPAPFCKKKRGSGFASPQKAFLLFRRGKCVFSKTAGGADPILRHIFPRRAGCNAVIGIAQRGIVDIPADTFVFHGEFLLMLEDYLKYRSSRPFSSSQASYPSLRHKRQSSLILLLVLSKSNPLRWALIWLRLT